MGYTTFDKAGYEAFKANDRDGPVHMLNLIKLRAEAVYEDGRQATGAEAYAAYGRESAATFAKLGGKIIWRGGMEQMLIGPEKMWDLCFIAEYPSVEAFASMHTYAEYRAAVVHRQAAVEDSRLIRMAPQALGGNFGE
ncbi:DUF1330 domain-containing protein [Shimia sp. R10_1]|uniref:DUF1330 domain-containing protein n=1 Tax=Shimia sp. R10_1 TaxID=2821095 RepID=UPI001ADD246C|nr:DUF1330 domain-containing protein [Shimia sp. R10_1]MBO9471995.1 DUF1330 domain-containing protein [Shimia sp. R10_1]